MRGCGYTPASSTADGWIAFDGKTLRGARDAARNLAHLLAGLCQRTGAVIAQLAVGAKTNEIPCLRKLLGTLGNIAGAVITADALHTRRETAESIIGAGTHYIFTVKDNQPKLREQMKSLRGNRSRSSTRQSSMVTAAPRNGR